MQLKWVSVNFLSPHQLIHIHRTTRFYKLSRSVLVNLDYVERLESNQLWMRGQSQSLSIPNANRAELMRKLTVVRTP